MFVCVCVWESSQSSWWISTHSKHLALKHQAASKLPPARGSGSLNFLDCTHYTTRDTRVAPRNWIWIQNVRQPEHDDCRLMKKGANGFKMGGWSEGWTDGWNMGRLWSYLLACCTECWVNTRLSASLSHFLFVLLLRSGFHHTTFTFILAHLGLPNIHIFFVILGLFPLSFRLVKFALSRSLSLSVCPSVYLSASAICSAWCECLALDETGVSLHVRNLTAQITWHNETWQIAAAVQKQTMLSERHGKWAKREREKWDHIKMCNVHCCLNEWVSGPVLYMCIHMGQL